MRCYLYLKVFLIIIININMNGLFNGLSFGIGFAIGTKIVDHYQQYVENCLKEISSFMNFPKNDK